MIKFKVSRWIKLGHCAVRILKGGDVDNILDRVAFIEKTPRVRLRWDCCMDAPFCTCRIIGIIEDDFHNWEYGPKGDGHECGEHQQSRDWCDERLKDLGYELH